MRQRQILGPLFFVLLLGAESSWAQTVDQKQAYEAYVKRDVNSWKRVIGRMHAEPNKSCARIAELVEYEYGYTAECIPCDRNDEAEQYLEHYKAYVDYFVECDYKTAEMAAYLLAYYTYRVGTPWLRTALVDNKSISLTNRSIKMDRRNAIDPTRRDNTQYFASAFFRGDARKGAIDCFLRVERAMVSRGKSKGLRLYLGLLIQIAECYVGVDEQTQTET